MLEGSLELTLYISSFVVEDIRAGADVIRDPAG
jgi:hypothetical protein